MAIERVDNWELVLSGADLNANNRYKIEDSHIRCALIREIGTDSSTLVDFGLRDHPFIDIDTFIAPYYKSSNNLNAMWFSGKRGLKWVFTGFELPLPLDMELEINNLASAERVYMKGTLYKNVMSADEPINRYLMARLIEHNYKQLRPLYWRDAVIDAAFNEVDEEYVLDTSGAVPDLVPWKPQDPKYTVAPSQNITYVIKNTIQVMWGDENLLPKDVEFRLKHDRIDVGAMPRLDHMFLPPADGITRYMEETLSVGGIDNCNSAATWGTNAADAGVTIEAQNSILKEGNNAIKITCGGAGLANGEIVYDNLASAFDPTGWTEIGFWIGATAGLDAGDLTFVLSSTDNLANPFVEAKLPKIAATAASADMSYVRVLIPAYPGSIKSLGIKNTSGGAITTNIYIDDIRALPLKVSGNPMQELVKVVDAATLAPIEYAANYATGEIELTYSTIPANVLVGYYGFRSGGGRDIFSLRGIKETYHKVTYPHKQSYVFVNKSGDTPSGEATMDLYTLAEYYQAIPPGQEISPSVFAAARPLLV